MANNRAIQILRTKDEGITDSNKNIELEDGQLLYNKQKNYLTVGNSTINEGGSEIKSTAYYFRITVREVSGYFDDNESVTSTQTSAYYVKPSTDSLDINSSKQLNLTSTSDLKLTSISKKIGLNNITLTDSDLVTTITTDNGIEFKPKNFSIDSDDGDINIKKSDSVNIVLNKDNGNNDTIVVKSPQVSLDASSSIDVKSTTVNISNTTDNEDGIYYKHGDSIDLKTSQINNSATTSIINTTESITNNTKNYSIKSPNQKGGFKYEYKDDSDSFSLLSCSKEEGGATSLNCQLVCDKKGVKISTGQHSTLNLDGNNLTYSNMVHNSKQNATDPDQFTNFTLKNTSTSSLGTYYKGTSITLECDAYDGMSGSLTLKGKNSQEKELSLSTLSTSKDYNIPISICPNNTKILTVDGKTKSTTIDGDNIVKGTITTTGNISAGGDITAANMLRLDDNTLKIPKDVYSNLFGVKKQDTDKEPIAYLGKETSSIRNLAAITSYEESNAAVKSSYLRRITPVYISIWVKEDNTEYRGTITTVYGVLQDAKWGAEIPKNGNYSTLDVCKQMIEKVIREISTEQSSQWYYAGYFPVLLSSMNAENEYILTINPNNGNLQIHSSSGDNWYDIDEMQVSWKFYNVLGV